MNKIILFFILFLCICVNAEDTIAVKSISDNVSELTDDIKIKSIIDIVNEVPGKVAVKNIIDNVSEFLFNRFFSVQETIYNLKTTTNSDIKNMSEIFNDNNYKKSDLNYKLKNY